MNTTVTQSDRRVRSYWEAMLGASVRYYEVDGVRTRVLEAGTSGPPIVMLHGAGGHAENFVYNLVALAQAGQVYALDLPGHGLNDRPPDNYTIERCLRHVEAFIDLVGGRAALVGLSLGSLLAAWTAIRVPEKISKVVQTTTFGFNTSGRSDAEITTDFARVRDNNQRAFATTDTSTIRQRMAPLVHSPELITDEMVAVRQHVYRLPGAAETMGAIIGDLYERRFELVLTPERLTKITAETLIVWGRYNSNPVSDAEAAAQALPHASLRVLEASGHWPHIEEATSYNELLLDFLLDA